MCVGYHSEVQLKEVYANGFEAEVEQRIADITSFLKKEYKKITGSSVALSKEGEIDVRVENSSRVRSWVTAKMHYKIAGLDKDMEVPGGSTDRLDSKWRDFVAQGDLGGKRPQNDTRKKS